jgi:PAS domain-containing protein
MGDKKSVSWVSPVSTVSFRGAYNGRYGSWPITGSRPFRHGGEEEKLAGKVDREGRGSLPLVGRGNDDVWDRQRREERKPIPQRPRQGARRKPGVLTIKAGMWFCFKGIMLATPPSIKDSGCDRMRGAARPQFPERGAAAPPWDEVAPGAEVLKRKPESVRKQESNRNVIAPSRFLWLEQFRGCRQSCRSHPPAVWSQSILRQSAMLPGRHPETMKVEIPAPSQDLHWKMELLRELQAELGSLYAFDQTLLEAMQEGLAVFASDGRLVFRNPRWQQFCDGLNWDRRANLDAFRAALGDPKWREVNTRLSQPGARMESEVQLGGQLWQIRAMRLAATNQPGTGALMVVATDLTARLERDRARAEALGFVTHELRTPSSPSRALRNSCCVIPRRQPTVTLLPPSSGSRGGWWP